MITPLALQHLIPHADLETEDVVAEATEAVSVDEDVDVAEPEAAAMPVAAVVRQLQIIKAPNLVANVPREKPPQLQPPHQRDSQLELEGDFKAHPYHQAQTEMRQRQIQSS